MGPEPGPQLPRLRGLGPGRGLRPRRGSGPQGDRRALDGRGRDSTAELLRRDDIDAVAIATPARTHAAIALAAFEAGKHVLVEKPLADNAEAAARWCAAAEAADRVLMIDHTYCYTPAVQLHPRGRSRTAQLGEILYIDSVRINLGLVQPDVDVFWDLAPHDLSILDFILPGGLDPKTVVSASGADPLGAGKACVGYLTHAAGLRRRSPTCTSTGCRPTKIRQMVIGGSRRTLVWDDLNPQQRVAIYDRGVDLATQAHGRRAARGRHRLLPARRHHGARAAGEGGARLDGRPSSPRRSARAVPRGPTGGPACGCCRCSRP